MFTASAMEEPRTQATINHAALLPPSLYVGTVAPQNNSMTSTPPEVSPLMCLATAGAITSQSQRVDANHPYQIASKTKTLQPKASQVGAVHSGRVGRARNVGNRSRRGKVNYSSADIDALLTYVEQVLPIGANMWALVSLRFASWAQRAGRPERDQESLKSKFDKLANTKESTGDPSCPPDVRRAKHASREIQANAVRVTLGEDANSLPSDSTMNLVSSEDDFLEVERTMRKETMEAVDECTVRDIETQSRRPAKQGRIGERRNKRPAGAGGVSLRGTRKDSSAVLVDVVSKIADKFGCMSDAFVQSSTQDLEALVSEKVEKALRKTNESIEALRELILSRLPTAPGL